MTYSDLVKQLSDRTNLHTDVIRHVLIFLPEILQEEHVIDGVVDDLAVALQDVPDLFFVRVETADDLNEPQQIFVVMSRVPSSISIHAL